MSEKSTSIYGKSYDLPTDSAHEAQQLNAFFSISQRPVVCVQGMGFVGSAMLAALSQVKDKEQNPKYSVVGIDLNNAKNYWKIACANEGLAPVISEDQALNNAFALAHKQGNLYCTWLSQAYSQAQVIVVDIHLDIQKSQLGKTDDYKFDATPFLRSLEPVAQNMNPEALVIIETTVPPGTTEKLVRPLFEKEFEKRGIAKEQLLLAHSYERVMPGKNYLHSITHYFRVFSGINERSRKKARTFLESFINTENYPLSELHSTTASEMAKVLENSYRAMNIAFVQEWTEFAEAAGVDLFQVTEAIHKRPTHKNLMWPGFGVGGYCLTKDPLLADWAYKSLFEGQRSLQCSLTGVEINDKMPAHTLNILRDYFGSLEGKKIGLLGVSYLNDVGDTRYSPSEYFVRELKALGAEVFAYDPLVSYWEEMDWKLPKSLNEWPGDLDAVVFAVKHTEFRELPTEVLADKFPRLQMVLDSNGVLSESQAKSMREAGFKVRGVGKGHWKEAEHE